MPSMDMKKKNCSCKIQGAKEVIINQPRTVPSIVMKMNVKPPSAWSHWCNVDTPNGKADSETVRKARKKCPDVCSEPISTECRVAETHIPYNETGDILKVACTRKGLICKNKQQTDNECEDYEVRYQCPPDRDECLDGTAECGETAECINTHGSYKCQCPTGFIGDGKICYEGAKCTGWGDPHYTTFDEEKFNFQGLCKYRLAEPCKDFGGVPDFNVVSKNKPALKEGVATAKFVEIKVYGFFLKLEGKTVLIDDEEATLPKRFEPASNDWPGSFLDIQMKSDGIDVMTDFGLNVLYGGSRISIFVPAVLKTHMCGLCGNYDGDAGKELYLPDGTLVDDPDKFADAWVIKDDDPLCKPITPPEPPCSGEAGVKAEARCGLLSDDNGPFTECLAKVGDKVDVFVTSCVYDICVDPENDAFYCPALEAFAKECENAGVPVRWRSAQLCAPQCPVNMEYEDDGPACPATCFDTEAPFHCPDPASGGCQCLDGYVMSGSSCVLLEDCGCTVGKNKYYKPEEKWFQDDCTAMCECVDPGEVECDNTIQCHKQGECYKQDDGTNSCRCKKGFKGTGRACFDEDECSSNQHKCDQNARCLNLEGAYDCTCLSGFTGDGFECEDVDECSYGTDQCSPNADCHNEEGSYECVCREGFEGDGRSCVEEKPLEPEEPTSCNVFQEDLCVECADCILLPDGSAGCVCPEGSLGDGMKGDGYTGCRVPSCPRSMIKHDTGCYSFHDIPKTFKEARRACQLEGGDLAAITNEASVDFAKDQMGLLGLSGQFWIGYTDIKMDGIYAWVDDTASDFENWAEGEPVQEGSSVLDCTAMGEPSDFKFTTNPCELDAGYICRKPLQLKPCPKGWEMLDGECYYASKQKTTYIEAYLRCVVHGANLASIVSEVEQEFIQERVLPVEDGVDLWIGLSKGLSEVSKHAYMWTDGQDFIFNNWDDGEPTSEMEQSCVYTDQLMKWDSDKCDRRLGFICKRSENLKEKCPEGSIRIGHNCYKVVTNPEPQPDAEAHCRRMGGGLASIHSEYEQYVVRRYLDSQSFALNPWIGYVERGTDGEYSWSDRSEADYTNWGAKQPNDVVDFNNCVMMMSSDEYMWNDEDCSMELPYLCEYRNTPCRTEEECHPDAQCSFGQCRCKKGYMGDGKDVCNDVNECEEGKPCPVGAECMDRSGGFDCTCQSGFVQSGDQCISLTKCATDADCNTLGECNDGNCHCQTGFRGDGKHLCENINECEEGTYECNPNADCKDKLAGYDCVCKDGFTGDGLACVEFPRNCDDVRLQNPEVGSGSYRIDPDGSGGLRPFNVMCIIRPDIGITVIPSDASNPRPVKSTDPTPESSTKTPKYTRTDAQVQGIIESSEFCYQNILYKCKGGAKFEGVSSWTDNNGEKTPVDMCYCGMLGTCKNPPGKCQCDGTFMGEQIDEFKVTDKTKLPIASLSVAGVEKGQKAWTSVGAVLCGPKQFDIPRDCDDARKNYNENRDGPILIDVDGPDGDESGNLEPFVAECDMSEYPGTGVTIIPNNLPDEKSPEEAGEILVEYPVSPEAIRKLIDNSLFCSQDMSYLCQNSGLMADGAGFWSGQDNAQRNYWAGGMGEENMCGCGITKSCDKPDVNCNCDIKDGKERKDFGKIIKKADLPVSSVMLTEIGADKKGTLTVGDLLCGQRQFGIEPTCQQYREMGYLDSYTFIIDPDGPPPRADEPIPATTAVATNENPFPVICEMVEDKPIGITTVSHDTEAPTKVDDTDTYSKNVTYLKASSAQLEALIDHSSYCTQEMSYACQHSVLHKAEPGNPVAYWVGRDGQKNVYFAGGEGSMCQCGIEGDCGGRKDVKCNCDANSDKEETDQGFLTNKRSLPVRQLNFGDTAKGDQDHGQHTLGRLQCYEVFETCYHMQEFYKKRPHDDIPANGRYMIDPDGALQQDPFEVYCHFPKTIIDIEAGNYFQLSDKPENVGPGAQCVKPTYTNTNKEQLEALTEKSGFCRQYGRFTCQHAPVSTNAFWKSSNGQKQKGWAGNAGGDKCACGEVGKCDGDGTAACNCDVGDTERRQDHGLFIDKKLLPVSEVCFGLGDEGEEKFAEYFLGSLECSNEQFGIPVDCQRLRNSKVPGESIVSEAWLIDPDQNGGLDPFPVYCELLKDPPIGITVIEPVPDQAKEIPPKGEDIPVTYKSSTVAQLKTLTDVSEYCTQDMSYACKEAALKLGEGFGAYSSGGKLLPYWAGNTGGEGCKGGACECGKTDLGSLLDKKVLPVSRVNIAAAAGGSRTLEIKDLRCFALLKTCHDIKMAGQDVNPNWNGRYGIDPDSAGGVDPFAVDCDFTTNPDIGITQIPHDTEEEVPVGKDPVDKAITYKSVSPAQAHELAQVSEFCLQGVTYKCKMASLMKSGGGFLDYKGVKSPKFAGADNGKADGCACVVLGTCPDKEVCRCDAAGLMPVEEGDYVTNRDILPVTGVQSNGIAEEGAEASFIVGKLRCGPEPFDLPRDCKEAMEWGYKTGEAIIWPSRDVDPFLVYCEFDAYPGKGVTIVPTKVVEAPVIGVTEVPVNYVGATLEQVMALVEESQKCFLPMKYECKATKFSDAFSIVTPEKQDVNFFGSGRRGELCNCGDQSRCGGDDGRRVMETRGCNCDIGDDKWRVDAGVFGYQGEMPVKSVNFQVQGSVQAKGKLTLGNMYCIDSCCGPIDLDECDLGFNDCHEKANCINRPGYYQCVCEEGYRGKGRPDVWANGRECYDDDECEMDLCPDNSDCKNIPGSYNCTCKKGYMETENGECVDIDECITGDNKCHKKAECTNTDGAYECTCRIGAVGDGLQCEETGTCSCSGPHCSTFDHRRVDFASGCRYVLARDSCADLTNLGKPTFEVQASFFYRNENQRRRGVAWVKDITVIIGDKSIGLLQNRKVTINGIRVRLPSRPVQDVFVFRTGKFVRVYAPAMGLKVIFDGKSWARVKVLDKYEGKTCGICGNYNLDPKDDFIAGALCETAGQPTENMNTLTSSWIIEEKENVQCELLCDLPAPDPCDNDEDMQASEQSCRDFLYGEVPGKANSRFSECIALLNQTGVDFVAKYLETCSFDACATIPKIKAVICEVAEHVVTDCLEDVGIKIDIGRWRMENGCVEKCGAHMVYKTCGSACPETCGMKLGEQVCTKQCVEGCFCDEGYVLDDDKCVKPKDCGCIMDDIYFTIGEKVFKKNCSETCECKRSGAEVTCAPSQCDANAACVVEDNVSGCFCNKGYMGSGIKCEDVNECTDDPPPCDENASCENTKGGFKCTCNEGFVGNGTICENINECLEGLDDCDENADCEDDIGSYYCVCIEGFRMNKKTETCEDVDECKSGRHDCHRKTTVCTNTPGSFECDCQDGFERIDLRECEDIDECEEGLDDCDKNAECGNRIGDYACTCNQGYEGSGKNCTDVNECERYARPCEENENCKNTDGSYECECKPGFAMVEEECQDVDECGDDALNDCEVENSLCKNSVGSFKCECSPGYQGDGKTKCEDINECTQPGPPVCGTNSKCTNKAGYGNSFTCTCKEGYSSPSEENRNCVDTDECAEETDDCHENAFCENVEASYTCQCQKGYDGDGKTCTDINECLKEGLCGPNSNCTNLPATYRCDCLDGFKKEGEICLNINECTRPELNDCDELAHCTDLDGTFMCQCFAGYSGSGKEGNCSPIDECELELDTCTERQNCVDKDPGFECTCKDGYEPFGSDCTDIDECSMEEDDCSEYADCDNLDPWFHCTCLEGFIGDGIECHDIDECNMTCKGQGQVCTNTIGSYMCECEEGYEPMTDGTCKDVDECADEISPCSENMDCKNTVGDYECVCVEGYVMASGEVQACTDENECERAEGSPCAADQICDNTVGGYTCRCYLGYEMVQGNCNDINECSNPLQCSSDAICTNTEGSYQCTCKQGFRGDGFECTDVNECTEGLAECSPNGICKNSPGTYECNTCKVGYEGDGKTCTDIDECAIQNGGCDKNAECINEDGGYRCECKEGFSGDGRTCNDIDECSTTIFECPPYSQCQNTEGGYVCICNHGYVMEFEECVNIDECAMDPESCGRDALCADTDGSYECYCPEYYEMHTDGKTCLAPNDCTYDPNRCRMNEICVTQSVGALCECEIGFQETYMGCQDIDECHENPRLCALGKECYNTIGSFECHCVWGYEMNNKSECIDIDECVTGNHLCEESATCKNTDGYFECTCEKGYEPFNELEGTISCADVDECSLGMDICDDNADCENSFGSYVCVCQHGFTGDGKTCKDIDECSGPNGCSEFAICHDGVGTYSCECVEGYMGDGFTCNDIDECINGDDDCAKNAVCVNQPGGFLCKCDEGYSGHCDACQDVDECATGLAECDDNAQCFNLDGTYTCDCPPGFQKVFKFCMDINECARGIDNCGRNGDCVNKNGTYECICHLGYDKNEDGVCSDVNECESNGQLCDDNAACYNTEGSYICMCHIGYQGDGETCTPIHPNTCGEQICHNSAQCKDNVCKCPPGSRGDPIYGTEGCVDIDECAEDTHDCDQNAMCRNTAGYFTCACNRGFVGDGVTCDDATPKGCDSPTACGKNTVCVEDGLGGFTCECLEGFERANPYECDDINECDEWFTCGSDTECYNTPGSYECICYEGFIYDAYSDYCEDIDECEEGTHDCDMKGDGSGRATCSNEDGFYECECKPGYEGDGKRCVEPNEPGCSKVCGQGQYCQLQGTEETCVCQSGFKPAELGGCEAIDECPDLCEPNASCDYDPAEGSFCECNDGYEGNGRYCQNTNECATGYADCDDYARCMDTDGSYECICPDGFSGDGLTCELAPPTDDNCGCGEFGLCVDQTNRICECNDGYEFLANLIENRCADVDECLSHGACHPYARCQNTPGSHTCTCNPGTIGDGFNFCNVEECSSSPCSPDAGCNNIAGGHTCNCNEGFTGDGYVCTPVGSPCNEANGGCGDNAACTTDAEMQVVCVCKAGFEGDGVGCVDVNECEEGKHDCSPDATCTDFEGGFTCACSKGFFGDGHTCENINECFLGIDDCSEFADCQDLVGGFMCICIEGFTGDGKICGRDSGCLTEKICDPNAECILLEDTYQCACNFGYRGDGKICTNVDAGKCEDVDGQWICECAAGYGEVDGLCMDVDECAEPSLNNCEEDTECRNYDGGFECICEDGKPTINGVCGGVEQQDVDECADYTMNNCDLYMTCHNTPHAYYCQCNEGYEGDGLQCTDINECMMGTSNCGANSQCFNLPGSSTCGCLSGFTFDEDEDCVDVDECGEEYDNDCSDYADCENNEGSYTCTCSEGYKGNGMTCFEINPCDEPGVCHMHAVCTNKEGAAICTCRPGYEGSGQECKKVNACTSGTHNCHPNARCDNHEDGFTCTCKTGFYGDGINACNDINECDPRTPNGGGHQCDTSNSDCHNSNGAYECYCKFGFTRDGNLTCKSVDLCKTGAHDCSDFAKCDSITGGFICTCNEGYDGNGKLCIDVDECLAETYDCPSMRVCVNHNGGYTCKCREGYKQEGENCVDMNECTNGEANCGENANCVNTKGAYVCVCQDGYAATPDGCVDADECATETDNCHENADCLNSVGSFTCTCREGYKGTGVLCTEIDKCKEAAVTCGSNAFCIDEGAGPTCKCNVGFEGNADTGCTDIDECTGVHDCHAKADCKNEAGGYACQCKKGYRGTGKDCIDIDECFEGLDDCNDNAACQNHDGIFKCSCHPGYTGDGKACTQVNECEINPNICSRHEECFDTDGSYHCQCVKGFRRNSADFCQDIDECIEGAATCHNYAGVCIDKDGGYDCKCKSGFEGDGRECADINECERKTSGCSENAVCTNIEGGSTCTCKAGFEGNGFTCVDIDECLQGLPCGYSATCGNAIGAYTCTCLPGFRKLEDGSCEDINECTETPTVCPEKAVCSNARGTYQCVCPKGFESVNDGKSCQKINPCLVNNCSPDADCVDEGLTFSCKCREGYNGDGVLCEDTDECEGAEKAGTDICHGDKCVNIHGGYECICQEGYELIGGVCTDINECSLPPTFSRAARCTDSEYCENDMGTYRCECKTGYERIDDVCVNINECENPNRCHPNAHCIDNIGSFSCECKEGYYGDGQSCVDIDDCAIDPAICGDPSYSKCRNTGGSYACICVEGYQEKDGQCQDVDECSLHMAECGSLGHCLNVEGGYLCECPQGYEFKNDDCANIDECAFGIDNCDVNAVCTDIEGSFTCKCMDGFHGDGLTCAQTCGETTCPNGQSCTVENDKPSCMCKCVGERCKLHGKVCGTNGVGYASEKDLIISACNMGMDIQVDYRGNCKRSCDDMRCPRHKICTLNKAGFPNCRCKECTKEEENSGPVCTDKYQQFYSICHFLQYQCNQAPNDKQVITTHGDCPQKVDCVVSEWGLWQPCSVSCGNGVVKKTREVTQHTIGEGEECPELEYKGNCYEAPCPDSPCAMVDCGAGQVCVMRDNKPVCECPDCTGLGEEPVCGMFSNGTRTVRNKCTLNAESCRLNETVFDLYPGKCGKKVPNSPLDCAVVPHFGLVETDSGCVTTKKQAINKCAGGCGSVTGFCCHPSEFRHIFAEVQCKDKNVKLEKIPVIKECECVSGDKIENLGAGLTKVEGFQFVYNK